MLTRVTALRYVTPLREGGSLPGIMEGDDDGTYVVKFTGAGQGPRTLVAEVLCAYLLRALGLPVPELVTVDLDPALAVGEPDEEVQDLLRASPGINLGIDYLPGALDLDAKAFPIEPGPGRSHPVVRRLGGECRPLLAQSQHAALARPAVSDRSRRHPDLRPPLAGCAGLDRAALQRRRPRAHP